MFGKAKTPSNGEIYRNSSYSGGNAILKIVTSGSNYTFAKLYRGSTYVSGLFIHPYSDAAVLVPSGDYTIKVASGSKWIDESEMFGNEGSYSRLVGNNGDSSFSLPAGSAATITLARTSGGNVSSRSISKSDF